MAVPRDVTPDDPAADPDWYLDNVVVPSGIERRPLGPAAQWDGDWRSRLRVARTAATGTDLAAAVMRAGRQGLVLTRQQARDAGLTDAEIRSLVRRRVWWPAGRGVVAVTDPAAEQPSPSPTARFAARRRAHALAAAAAALTRPEHVVSGPSAAVLHGLPVLRLPAAPVLTTARVVAQGDRRNVLVRSAALPRDEVTDWFGDPVTSLARTVVDLARTDPEAGLVAADAALHERLVGPADLRRVAAGCSGWPGMRAAREIVGLASPLVESPLESLTRAVVREAGLPQPDPQVTVVDPVTGRSYRLDLLWREQRLVLEADGRVKYRDDELWREKRRELALTRLGYRVERVTWADLVRYRAATVTRWRCLFTASPPG